MLRTRGVCKANICDYICFLCVPVDVCLCMGVGRQCATVRVLSSEENLKE